MPKHLFITLFALFGISTAATAQLNLAQEIGIFAGPVTLQSDFGERNNFDTNVGNTGFGIGIMHFINFSAANNRESFFTEHFKVRTDLSFSKTTLKHFGHWVEHKPNGVFAQQLKNMYASSSILGLGTQLEFSPFMKIHDFENTIGALSPYGSIGFQVSYYSTKIGSNLGDIRLPAVTPGKYLTPSDGRAHGFSSENGVALSATAALGVHYKLSTMSDLMFETRFQMYNSDWIDGLNPNKDIYTENKSNDWQVWFNFGYIYYLEF
ncbi:THC0290_0291 family protein [Flavobacterium hungaricum]|uniref:Glutamate dehydrogenase n=1 Tax=Flavobacterium hungaricum TaxID=2082725 RepID=A0ABR9TQK4_9FLAO|nr:glutamate dehydrogenase [Flavobacterium hungaricum]MBE8727339.1 glutamate dehydrogenase [Flavobacterium hungaricum]